MDEEPVNLKFSQSTAFAAYLPQPSTVLPPVTAPKPIGMPMITDPIMPTLPNINSIPNISSKVPAENAKAPGGNTSSTGEKITLPNGQVATLLPPGQLSNSLGNEGMRGASPSYTTQQYNLFLKS